MDPTTGGPCQGIRNSVPGLQELGCENEVVCLDAPDADYLETEGVCVHAIGASRGPWASHPALRPWLRENLSRFDAVIVHGLWQYHGYAVMRVVQELKQSQSDRPPPRVFVMPHGMLDPWFQNDPSRRIKAWRNLIYWKLIEGKTVAQADGLLFTCQRELELARQPFRPYRPRAELNVGYGVLSPPAGTAAGDETFRAACPGLNDRPYLLYLSRIHAKKGVDLLLRAYAKVARGEQVPANLPALVVAGPTDSPYADEMKRLAGELGLLSDGDASGTPSPAIFFPGMLQGEAKWGAFYGSEAFVLPSHQENFGIAAVEALACGKPVLISDQVNICDEIASDGAGYVEGDDQAGVERLLERWLVRGDDERQEMGLRSVGCYARRFKPEAAARRLLDAIGEPSL